MEVIPYHPVILVTQEDVKKARQFYGLDDVKKIGESLDTIEEWCQKQAHLVEASKYLGRNILERLFLSAKGSVEGTKKKIDKLCTYRGMMPEMSLLRSIEEFDKFSKCLNYISLPKLSPTDQSRVQVTQFLTDKLGDFSILTYFRYIFMIGEYRLLFDYSLSERLVIDLKHINLGLLSKLNPFVLKKAEVLASECYGAKIKGIHILNAPSFVDRLVFLLKQGLREKVASRVHVHSTYEELHQHIPKEILPEDYDGDGPSCAKLAKQWKDVFNTEEAQKFIKESEFLVSDESKRQTAKFNEEYLGMPGSFRKLTVD